MFVHLNCSFDNSVTEQGVAVGLEEQDHHKVHSTANVGTDPKE